MALCTFDCSAIVAFAFLRLRDAKVHLGVEVRHQILRKLTQHLQ
jgi:hypothetical protein